MKAESFQPSHRNKKDSKRILRASVSNKLENADKIDKFLGRHKLPTLTQKDMNIELMKNFTQNKSQTKMVSLADSTKCLKKI